VHVEGLIENVSSIDPVLKSLGTALLNALSNYLLWDAKYKVGFTLHTGTEIIDLLTSLVKEPVLVVGNMAPLVRRLKEMNISEVKVLERNPLALGGVSLPDPAIYRLVPKKGTLIVTGATLVNDTIDMVLVMAIENGYKVILVDPTAGVHPKPLFEKGIYAVALMHPINVEEVIKIIKLGGGRWSFSRYCRHYLALKE